MSNPALERLLQHPALFRAGHRNAIASDSILSTGYPPLDELLAWGGWPAGKLIEIIPEAIAIGELTLLLPTLADITREGRAVVLVDPPHVPYAPALTQHHVVLDRCLITQSRDSKDPLWTAEQCLKSGACGAVVFWEQALLNDRSLRRLQLAAESGVCLAFLFRYPRAATQASPAALRLLLAPSMGALSITVLKGQGASGRTLELSLNPVT
ncbi:MAG TPA: translesion DNA synthesis-associated protein ImuA [Gammaproteobacteria bacterium]|nr:translesion DNA synthesis-associated protein ImuA [Gammaproteobacteria bacterium]